MPPVPHTTPALSQENAPLIRAFTTAQLRDFVLFVLWDADHFAVADALHSCVDVSAARMTEVAPEIKAVVWGLGAFLFGRLPSFPSEVVMHTLVCCAKFSAGTPTEVPGGSQSVTSRSFVLGFATWLVQRALVESGVCAAGSGLESVAASEMVVAAAAAAVETVETVETVGAVGAVAKPGKKRRFDVREGDD